MLVKDGQEIKPDDEDEPEDRKDDFRLSDDEIQEAIQAYAEYKRGRTQQVKAAPKPELSDEEADEIVETLRANPPKQVQKNSQEQDNGYGEYKFADKDDDYPTGLAAFKEFVAPILSRINIKIVGLALIALVLGIAGYRSYIAKVNEVVTATPAAAQSDQPAQSVDQPAPLPPANCTWTTEMATITSKDNGQVCLSTGVCFAVDIQTLGILQVGQEIPQQVCK